MEIKVGDKVRFKKSKDSWKILRVDVLSSSLTILRLERFGIVTEARPDQVVKTQG